MNSKTPMSSPQDLEHSQKAPLSQFRWLFFLTTGLAVLLLALVVFQLIFLRSLSNRVEILERRAELKDVTWLGGSIIPNANVIQFLNNGFSIEFEQVIYEPAGLHLIGYFGNPKFLTLHDVRLRFSARKNAPLEDFRKGSNETVGDLTGSRSLEEIGIAAAPVITIIRPGTRERFDVTIPNVRYTKDGLTLSVSLDGGRYTYNR